LAWASDFDYGSATGDFAVNIGFADFNQDGIPEVYLQNKIYNAETGHLLGTAEDGTNRALSWAHWTHNSVGWRMSSPIAADVTGDSRLEMILGNEIYDVKINNPDGISNNKIKRVKRISPPAGVPVEDGHVQVADFNSDGHLDVLVSNRNTGSNAGGTVSVYVWDVYNNTVSNPLLIGTTWSGKSIPLIADVNNDKQPDIIIQCDMTGEVKKVRAYTYDAGTKTFSFLWGREPNEDSYSNACTLFDFNQDNKNEVLFTDQVAVRILDGATGEIKNELAFSETTVMQIPIIADVDADGSAEIIACGANSLNIFKSSTTTPWAPARRVWNQYMYNSVNVNEDLTVPKYQMNPATVFPGLDGDIGTVADNVRPYNNSLQQQTKLSTNGTPLWPAPSTVVDSTFYFYNAVTDSMFVTVDVINTGDAPFVAPFRITAYMNSLGNAKKHTYAASDTIDNGSTARITFGIPNYTASWGDSLVIRVNDAGNTFSDQAVCDSTYRDVSDGLLLLAMNDFYNTAVNNPVKFDPKTNDSILPMPVGIVAAIDRKSVV
jgi:hypothetical protein